MIRTSLLITCCFISLVSGSSFEPHYNQTIIRNELNWPLMKAPITQQISGQTFTRVLIKIPLHILFPIPSNLVDFRSSQIWTEFIPNGVICVSSPLEFYFVVDDQNEMYFLTSINRPTTLIVTFNLNVNLFGEQFQKLVTIYAEMTRNNYQPKFVFSFKIKKNTPFGKVFAQEGRMLNYFRRSLWGFEQSPGWFEENSNLDIVSYKVDSNSLTVEMGSDLPFSKRLLALVQAKDANLKQCNSTKINELDWFEAETDLEMDLCSVSYREANYDSSPGKHYAVEGRYNLTICVSSECKPTSQAAPSTPRPPFTRRLPGNFEPWWARIIPI